MHVQVLPEDLLPHVSEGSNTCSKPWEVGQHWLSVCLLGYCKCKRCTHTHTHTHHVCCKIHQVIAYWHATMSAGISVMNVAKAFNVSTLPLCQLGYLFKQRVTWMQAEWDGGGRYRDYTWFNPVVSWYGKDPSVIDSDSPCKAFSPPPNMSSLAPLFTSASCEWGCV